MSEQRTGIIKLTQEGSGKTIAIRVTQEGCGSPPPSNNKVFFSNVSNNGKAGNRRFASGVINTEDGHYFSGKSAEFEVVIMGDGMGTEAYATVKRGSSTLFTVNTEGTHTFTTPLTVGNGISLELTIVSGSFSQAYLKLLSVEGEAVCESASTIYALT